MRTAETSETITETRRMAARVPADDGDGTSGRRGDRLLDWLAPAALTVLMLLATWYNGAFALRRGAPVALCPLGLVAAAAGRGALHAPERAARVALAGIWGFAAWTLASSLW